MPARGKVQVISTANGSDLRQLEIQHNSAVNDLALLAFGGSINVVWAWQTAASNSGQALGRGSTDTDIASGAFKFAVNGIAEAKAAVTTGTAIGAQTVPADTWASYALDIAAGGSITVSASAANATTGYATEALAIAAVVPQVTAKARMGYITVKTAAGLAWIAATDGLAGGSSGNVASETNYYPFDGVMSPTGVATTCNPSGVDGALWSGGRNGILIPSILAIGSTDTRVSTTAFTYNARGICNIAKGAVAAGTALGALGTIPAGKWGLLCLFINSLGTITYQSAPANYTSGYDNEPAAKGALGGMFPTANLAMIGYVTVQAQAANAWIAGTDAFAGGSTANEAQATNYYPIPGVVFPTSGVGSAGITAAQIASGTGTILTSANL